MDHPKLTTSQIQFLKQCNNDCFNEGQMVEVRYGFLSGMSMDKVQFYAKKEFDRHLMFYCRRGFEIGLTIEQVKLCARTEFDYNQMNETFLGFEQGLSTEQVALYANKALTWRQMRDVREEFEKLGYDMKLIRNKVALMILES